MTNLKKLFSRCTNPDVAPLTSLMPSYYLTDKPVATSKGADLFENEKEEDELFSSKPKITKPAAPPPKAKPSSDLFSNSTEDDLFSAPSKPAVGKRENNMCIENRS